MKNTRMIAAALAAFSFMACAPQATEAATMTAAQQQRIAQQRAAQQKQAREQSFQNQLYNAYQRGVNAYRSKNYSLAVNYLSKVVQYERKAQIYAMLGDSYYQMKQKSQAIKYLGLAIGSGAKDYTTLTDIGYAYMDIGNYQYAVRYLGAAISCFPNDADILWNLGLSYDKVGNRNSAVTVMKRLIAANPQYNPDSYAYVGMALNDAKQVKAALQYFEKGVRAFPQDAGLNFHVGDNLYSLGDYEGCIPYLQQSLKIAPGNLDALWTLGMACVQLDDLDSAQGICEQMQKIAPKDQRTIDLCKTVQEKVQQKMLQQQMEQDMMNQTMQPADGAADAATQTDEAAMAMAMG